MGAPLREKVASELDLEPQKEFDRLEVRRREW